MNYFKRKWNIKSNWHLLLILAVFAATGFSFLYVKTYVFAWVGYDKIESSVWKVMVYVILGYPVYNVLLLSIGALTGQWKFFSRFVLKMNARLIGKKL